MDWFAFWERRGYLSVKRRKTLGRMMISMLKDDEENQTKKIRKENGLNQPQ